MLWQLRITKPLERKVDNWWSSYSPDSALDIARSGICYKWSANKSLIYTIYAYADLSRKTDEVRYNSSITEGGKEGKNGDNWNGVWKCRLKLYEEVEANNTVVVGITPYERQETNKLIKIQKWFWIVGTTSMLPVITAEAG